MTEDRLCCKENRRREEKMQNVPLLKEDGSLLLKYLKAITSDGHSRKNDD